jgi:hypothetical protein
MPYESTFAKWPMERSEWDIEYARSVNEEVLDEMTRVL